MSNTNNISLKNKVNIKYKNIGVVNNRAGIIRQIRNLKGAPPPSDKDKKRRIKGSASLPAIKYDQRVPDNKMINIFDQG